MAAIRRERREINKVYTNRYGGPLMLAKLLWDSKQSLWTMLKLDWSTHSTLSKLSFIFGCLVQTVMLPVKIIVKGCALKFYSTKTVFNGAYCLENGMLVASTVRKYKTYRLLSIPFFTWKYRELTDEDWRIVLN